MTNHTTTTTPDPHDWYADIPSVPYDAAPAGPPSPPPGKPRKKWHQRWAGRVQAVRQFGPGRARVGQLRAKHPRAVRSDAADPMNGQPVATWAY